MVVILCPEIGPTERQLYRDLYQRMERAADDDVPALWAWKLDILRALEQASDREALAEKILLSLQARPLAA